MCEREQNAHFLVINPDALRSGEKESLHFLYYLTLVSYVCGEARAFMEFLFSGHAQVLYKIKGRNQLKENIYYGFERTKTFFF
jgi:hypothetical protein